MGQHYLSRLFAPQSVAVFGASERPESVGTLVFRNLLQAGFRGSIHAINPKHRRLQGKRCYPDLTALDKPVDLAVIATPAHTVPAVMQQCGEHGVSSAIVLTAGFHEIGDAGARIEHQMLEIARRYGIRIIGPNCLGLIRPGIGLNATFSLAGAQGGNLALVSQSGAMCTAILDWAQSNCIGFSAVVSLGMSLDVDFGDVLDFLASDGQTHAILLYIEGLHRSRRFMSALRAAARIKPVIAIKVGRHEAGSMAVMSHTGALVGSDDAFQAALARSGVVRAMTIGQMFSAARTLSSRYRSCGNRLCIITNGGGPGVMAADRAADLGLHLAVLQEQTLSGLSKVLPNTWSGRNPVDVIGDAPPARYQAAVELCLQDPGVDGVVVILTPQAMTQPLAVAQALITLADQHEKPLLACWMGGSQVLEARDAFGSARIPCFHTPEAAVEAFSFLTAYHRNQELLLQTPGPTSRRQPPDVEGAGLIIESALAEQRQVLSETESGAVLGAFRIPTVRSAVAHSPNEALVLAQSMGFPVAMKINSVDVSHKSDVGGVRLNLTSAQQVRTVYNEIIAEVLRHRPEARIEGVTIEQMYQGEHSRELMVGLISDPVFGPVISFGIGGTQVEILGDSALALPPLNRMLIRNLIQSSKAGQLLGSYRNRPAVDMEALEQVLLRVSEIACELPWIREMDINPLMVDEHGAIAVDARIRVDFVHPSADPYAHMAIHPYPIRLVQPQQLGDGTNITVRPIRPEDADMVREFINGLSEEAKYFRFMRALHQVTQEMLVRFTQIDYDREMALIAAREIDGVETELGVARYVINPDARSCEFALVVGDRWQKRGLGHILMHDLMQVARDRGLELMQGEVLASNSKMLELVKALGFEIHVNGEDPAVRDVSIRL